MTEIDQIAISFEDVYFSFKVRDSATSLKEFIHKLGRKSFLRREILSGISFNINHGDSFAVLGRNGSGKSTLLRLVSGIMKEDRGFIRVRGKVSPVLALGVGLEPELSGYDNISLCCLLMQVDRERRKDFISRVIAYSELSDEDLKLQVKRFSSGMMSRLAFSIAISDQPEILIIDEVLSVGDVGFQAKCFNTLEQLKNSGTTIVFVSHSVGDVQRLCNRGIVLDHGQIVAAGSADEIISKYEAICI